jgi:hypothetical protein
VNLVSENINESIKHLPGRSEEEINEKLSKEIDKWIATHNVIDGVQEWLPWEDNEDNKESVFSMIIGNIPPDILKNAIKEAINDIEEYIDGM